ncbi:MAG: uncharacterized protein JWO12_2341 [Frankiales bacterium]|nr:uncharacterized protein [Frankiales bacterium]
MEKVRFGPDRTTLAVVLVFALGSLPLGLSSPYLAPLLVLPVAAAAWVLRARVAATSTGLEVCNGLGVRRVAWADVTGFDVPDRGPVTMLTERGQHIRLTALPRHRLRQLLELSKT